MGAENSILPLKNFPQLDIAALFDALPMAVLVLDAAHNVQYANAMAEQVLATGASNLVGQPMRSAIVQNTSWQALFSDYNEYDQGIKVTDMHVQPAAAGATSFRANVHVTGFGSEKGCVVMVEPLLVSGKLDSQMHQQKAVQSAAVMAHILAHEVRNPLSGIKGAAQFLKSEADDDAREMLEVICHEVDRIGALMEQVECFSDVRPVKMEAVNIHEVLQHVKKLAQSGVAANITIEENYDPSLPDVRGNRHLLVQALLNLVKNAAEELAAIPNPVIRLKTSYRSGFRKAAAQGEEAVSLPICIMVEDNGAGIDSGVREQIFDPFVTTKSGGKGLGLAVVAKAVADHGGVILLEESKAGKTIFAIQLATWKNRKI